MKAVVLCGKGKVEYRDVPKPEIGEDDILLEVKACGICGKRGNGVCRRNPARRRKN